MVHRYSATCVRECDRTKFDDDDGGMTGGEGEDGDGDDREEDDTEKGRKPKGGRQ